MMLGIPARSSTAMPMGRRRGRGQISVRKIAIPMPTGIATSMARNEVISVPAIGASPPNFCVTGFQKCVQINGKPKAWIEGQASVMSAQKIPANNRSTNNAQASVRRWNKRSVRCEWRNRVELGEELASWLRARSTIKGGGVQEKSGEAVFLRSAIPLLYAPISNYLRNRCEGVTPPKARPTSAATVPALDLVPARYEGLLHGLRKRHIVQAGGHLIAILVGPLEELQGFFRRRRVLRLLIDKDESRAGDRPCLCARLVCQKRTETIGRAPGGARRRRRETRRRRTNGLAVTIDHAHVGQFVL